MYVIVNGQLIAEQSAAISLLDRGLLLADGLFETLCFFQGKINFFDFHWERLVSSLKKLYIPVPFSKKGLLNKIYLLINAESNRERCWSIRLTITRGIGNGKGISFSSKVKPNYFITMTPWLPPKKNVTLMLASSRRNEHSVSTQIKSLNYLDNILARHEANLKGFDDAIFLNSKGFITESTVANLFIVKDNIIYTPPLNDGLLPGITRKVILQEAALQKNIIVKECSVSLCDLKHSSELFLSNALVGIQRVVTVENYFSTKNSLYFDLIQVLYQNSLNR